MTLVLGRGHPNLFPFYAYKPLKSHQAETETLTLHPSRDRESSQPTPPPPPFSSSHYSLHQREEICSPSLLILGEKSFVDLEPQHKVRFLRESLKVFEVYSDVESWKIVRPPRWKRNFGQRPNMSLLKMNLWWKLSRYCWWGKVRGEKGCCVRLRSSVAVIVYISLINNSYAKPKPSILQKIEKALAPPPPFSSTHSSLHRREDICSPSLLILGEKSSVGFESQHKVRFLSESFEVFEVYSDVENWKIVRPRWKRNFGKRPNMSLLKMNLLWKLSRHCWWGKVRGEKVSCVRLRLSEAISAYNILVNNFHTKPDS
ncbi:hypothetical protein CDAR_580701 [Caerostris darwini]|uniref:Maturase K n=1 Tax=Caerostris darwini TaxID=1538125 RepID=A0AAV4TSU5_9ARAC|nr:hypothetical protein CDAR_580701 [Caerostris darwini]